MLAMAARDMVMSTVAMPGMRAAGEGAATAAAAAATGQTSGARTGTAIEAACMMHTMKTMPAATQAQGTVVVAAAAMVAAAAAAAMAAAAQAAAMGTTAAAVDRTAATAAVVPSGTQAIRRVAGLPLVHVLRGGLAVRKPCLFLPRTQLV
jgi:hypothetical protein